MKIISTTSRKNSENSNVDFYLASEIYKLNKAAKASNVPRLRATDHRNITVKKKERMPVKTYVREHFKMEFTFLRRSFQKVLAIAHIH